MLGRVETVARDLGVSVPLARKIFGEIIAHSVTRQAAFLSGVAAKGELRVAFQGVPYAYSLARRAEIPRRARRRGRRSRASGASPRRWTPSSPAGLDLAILPIENTTAGSINQVYDLLLAHDVAIVGEETWRVDHCLAGPAEVPLDLDREGPLAPAGAGAVQPVPPFAPERAAGLPVRHGRGARGGRRRGGPDPGGDRAAGGGVALRPRRSSGAASRTRRRTTPASSPSRDAGAVRSADPLQDEPRPDDASRARRAPEVPRRPLGQRPLADEARVAPEAAEALGVHVLRRLRRERGRREGVAGPRGAEGRRALAQGARLLSGESDAAGRRGGGDRPARRDARGGRPARSRRRRRPPP